MQFDPENKIVKLCAQGMELEGENKNAEAAALFQQAWEEATTNLEQFIAAHYVARHQKSITDKLQWDETALRFALKVTDKEMKGTYPSLYLNIAKCYEDLNNPEKAGEHYELALLYSVALKDDGYGKLIRSGIKKGLERVLR